VGLPENVGCLRWRLLQCTRMADWRQIQARIRKAKAAPDPAAQLGELFSRTRDGMVAFELAKLHESAGANAEAVQWYTTAAERFRRPQWRTKAAEALARLGAQIPEAIAPQSASAEPVASKSEVEQVLEVDTAAIEASLMPAPEELEAGGVGIIGQIPELSPQSSAAAAPPAAAHKKRRRGHRGGRGRRRGRKPATAQPAATVTGPAGPTAPVHREQRPPMETAPPRVAPSYREERPAWPPIAEQPPEPAVEPVRGRAGDPGLASRMSHLESQLRRLLASTPHHMDEADQAPAGPGVFLVTDSDQVTFYHAESCQTLRIGIANQLRADRRAPRGAETLRTKFADHLGISESQVAKYLNQHCVVRWLQLDEGAGALAHFTIAVLKPALDQ